MKWLEIIRCVRWAARSLLRMHTAKVSCNLSPTSHETHQTTNKNQQPTTTQTHGFMRGWLVKGCAGSSLSSFELSFLPVSPPGKKKKKSYDFTFCPVYFLLCFLPLPHCKMSLWTLVLVGKCCPPKEKGKDSIFYVWWRISPIWTLC